ncbi:hypothetical protein SLS60_009331 [Paraconiothyrium brasiliense]|uniref:Uncharacterized protein n=1 Tax=Paraconiothyrium brasiliense TaxID=300254 RepID=A0ABR3QY48_9PLEO
MVALFARVYLREWLHLTGHPVDAVHPGLPPRRPLLELGVTDFDINDESSYTQGTVMTEKQDLVIDLTRQFYKFKSQLRKLIQGRPTSYNWPPEERAAHDLAEMKSMAVLARSILTNCPEVSILITSAT